MKNFLIKNRQPNFSGAIFAPENRRLYNNAVDTINETAQEIENASNKTNKHKVPGHKQKSAETVECIPEEFLREATKKTFSVINDISQNEAEIREITKQAESKKEHNSLIKEKALSAVSEACSMSDLNNLTEEERISLIANNLKNKIREKIENENNIQALDKLGIINELTNISSKLLFRLAKEVKVMPDSKETFTNMLTEELSKKFLEKEKDILESTQQKVSKPQKNIDGLKARLEESVNRIIEIEKNNLEYVRQSIQKKRLRFDTIIKSQIKEDYANSQKYIAEIKAPYDEYTSLLPKIEKQIDSLDLIKSLLQNQDLRCSTNGKITNLQLKEDGSFSFDADGFGIKLSEALNGKSSEEIIEFQADIIESFLAEISANEKKVYFHRVQQALERKLDIGLSVYEKNKNQPKNLENFGEKIAQEEERIEEKKEEESEDTEDSDAEAEDNEVISDLDSNDKVAFEAFFASNETKEKSLGTAEKLIKDMRDSIIDIRNKLKDEGSSYYFFDPESKKNLNKYLNEQEDLLKKYEAKIQQIKDTPGLLHKEYSELIFPIYQDLKNLSEKFSEEIAKLPSMEAVDSQEKKIIKISFYSPKDIFSLFKEFWDIYDAERENKKKIKRIEFRQNSFRGLSKSGILKKYQSELEGKALEAEKEIDEWEEEIITRLYLSSYRSYQLIDLFHQYSYERKSDSVEETRNRLQFLAFVLAMKDQGVLDWNDPHLWRNLERVTQIKMPLKAKTDKVLRDNTLRLMFTKAWGKPCRFDEISAAQEKNFKEKTDEQMDKAKIIAKDRKEGKKTVIEMFEMHMMETYNDKERVENFNKYGQIDLNNIKSKGGFYREKTLDPHLASAIITALFKEQEYTMAEKFFYVVRGISMGFLPLSTIDYIDDKGLIKHIPSLKILADQKSLPKIQAIDRKITGGRNFFDCTSQEKKKYFFEGDPVLIDKYLRDEGVLIADKQYQGEMKEMHKDDAAEESFGIVSVTDFVPNQTSNKAIPDDKKRGYLIGSTNFLNNVSIDSDKKTAFVINSLSQYLFINGVYQNYNDKNKKHALSNEAIKKVPKAAYNSDKMTTIEYANITQNFIQEFVYAIEEYGNFSISNESISSAEGFVNMYLKAGDKNQATYVEKNYKRDLAILIQENVEIFKFLHDSWKSKKAFASLHSNNNAKRLGTNEFKANKRVSAELRFNRSKFGNSDYFEALQSRKRDEGEEKIAREYEQDEIERTRSLLYAGEDYNEEEDYYEDEIA